MSALAYHLPVTAPLDRPVKTEGGAPRLDWLRRIGARTRAMAGEDLFRACALLGADGTPQAADTYAVALCRVLPRALGQTRMRFYQPGAAERSFDENWLIAALDAADRGDQHSLTFLLARRLPQHARRQVAFLLTSLSRALGAAS